MHDVGVAGLHRRLELLFLGGLGGAGHVAELLAVDRRDVHDLVVLDRRRQVPAQARLRLGADVLAEAQDHRGLAGLELVDAEVRPRAEHAEREQQHGQVGDRARDAPADALLGRLLGLARHQLLCSILRAAASLAR